MGFAGSAASAAFIIQTRFLFFVLFKSFPTLFSAILCVVELAPHHIFSQDFQSQAILGQDTKAELSHSSLDSNETWQ